MPSNLTELIKQANELPQAHGDGLTINASKADFPFQLDIREAEALRDGRISTSWRGGVELDAEQFADYFARVIERMRDAE